MGVAVLAGLAALTGLVELGAGVSAMGTGAQYSNAFNEVLLAGIDQLLLAGLTLAFAIGAAILKPWAWTLGVSYTIVSLLLTVIAIVMGVTIPPAGVFDSISLVINSVVLAYLFRAETRRAFGKG
jgi:hypothetical protein